MMVRKEDVVDFYSGFSRKELQGLCKKYNLPANRSSSDMVESLASYIEKNSLNSVGFGVSGNRDCSATTSRAPANRTWDVKRDSYGNELNITRGDCFQRRVAREPGFVLGDTPHYQEQNGGLIGSECAPPTDSRLENRMKEVDNGDSPSSSSFEFHVSLEEGISLSVDLNFNPSEWINSMRDKVDVYDSMRSRHSDIVIDTATKCKKLKSSMKDEDERALSPAMKDNTQVPSNGERSLASPAIIKEGSEICEGKNGLNMSVPDSLGPGQLVSLCVESYSKSCCVNPVESDCVDPPGKKLTSESVMLTAQQNHPAGEMPEKISMESFQKVGNSGSVLCPRGAGSELSSSVTATYRSNPPCSPPKISKSLNISSSELIIDRESTNYSEGKNLLLPNTEEQEKSEVLSEQARSE